MSTPCKSVLIVDDNLYIRKALRSFVEEKAQMNVCGEAADGPQAVEAAKSLRPSVILMDVAMPFMNGVEAASVIRKSAPDTRIILFTLYAETLGQDIARAAGIDLVVAKSEGAPALIDALNRVFEGAPPAD